MRSIPTTPLAIAATLADAIAEGHAVIDVTSAGTLPPAVLDTVEALVATVEDAAAARRRSLRVGGSSLTERLASLRAQATWSEGLRDTLAPLIEALEVAGVTLDLLPGLKAADRFADPEPALAGKATGVELHLRPLPLGRAA